MRLASPPGDGDLKQPRTAQECHCMLPVWQVAFNCQDSEAAQHTKQLDRGSSASRRLCGLPWTLTHSTPLTVDEKDTHLHQQPPHVPLGMPCCLPGRSIHTGRNALLAAAAAWPGAPHLAGTRAGSAPASSPDWPAEHLPKPGAHILASCEALDATCCFANTSCMI